MLSKGEMEFNPETHEYTLNGEKYTSVTRLMKRYGLSTDYSFVSEETLKRAAERGRIIHGEIENYIHNGEIGFTPELGDFIELCERNKLKPLRAEVIAYNSEYKVAGTIDVIGELPDGKIFLGDNKTTSSLNKKSLAIQLGIYAYLTEIPISKFYGFHLRPDGKSKLAEVQPMPDEEIIMLMERKIMEERNESGNVDRAVNG